MSSLASRTERLRLQGLRLLAEKVETREEFEIGKQAGFTLFQGYFWGRPETVTGRTIPASAGAYLQLFEEVSRRHFNVNAAKDIIKRDPSLSLSLLRYINSGLFRWMSRIDSIHRAVVLLGRDELRRWAAMLSLTSPVGHDLPRDLVERVTARGRFCELLAREVGQSELSMDAFFAGLFSMADIMLGVTMERALEEIPLSAESRAALAGANTPLGDVYRCVQAFEAGDWARFSAVASRAGASEDIGPRLHREALAWAREVTL